MRDSDCTSGTRDEQRYWTGYCRGCIVSGGGNGAAEPGIRSVNTALCLQTPDLALACAVFAYGVSRLTLNPSWPTHFVRAAHLRSASVVTM